MPAATQSALQNPQSLPPLTPPDRDRLDLFSHVDADLVNLARNLHIQPTEALEWSIQPHIQPWIALLTKARRDHRETDLSKSLQTALDNLRRIIDSQAADKIKVTAVNSMVKLAHTPPNGLPTPPGGGPGGGVGESLSPPNLKTLHSNANCDLMSVEHSHDLRTPREDIPFFYDPIKPLPEGGARVGCVPLTTDRARPIPPSTLQPLNPSPRSPPTLLQIQSQLPL